MSSNYLKILTYSFILFSLSAFFLFSIPQNSFASTFSNSLDATANATGHKSVGISPDLPAMIGKMIYLVLSFIGVIFLILMIYAGYIWMLARGNEQEVEKARTIIKNSIIGIIIILSAYAITYLFMSNIGAKTIGDGTSSSGSSGSNSELCQICQSEAIGQDCSGACQ